LVEGQNVYKADERSVSVYEQKRALPDFSVVDSHEGLAFEKLHVRNMMRNPHLAKSIADAGWSTLVSITDYKAEKAGKPFVLVKPEGTTQECSGCGIAVAKSLAETVHHCSYITVLDATLLLIGTTTRPSTSSVGQGLSEVTPVEKRPLQMGSPIRKLPHRSRKPGRLRRGSSQ
jgi:IS605 OrfB family transposase